MLKFEFGKFTEVTDLAFEVNSQYAVAKYTRIFVCPDVNDIWLVRVLPETDKNYNYEPSIVLMERDKIGKDFKRQKITFEDVKEILINDELENWDYFEHDNIESVIEMLDGSYGINNLKSTNDEN